MSTTDRLPFIALPAVGSPMGCGTFAGLTTRKDGVHCAVVLLPDQGTDLAWQKAMIWAENLKAELPTRPVAALLFANLKDQLRPRWHWTSEEDDASSAWYCFFTSGYQVSYHRKSFEGCAVAVRTIQLTD